MTVRYIDPVNGNDAFDGSTWTPTTDGQYTCVFIGGSLNNPGAATATPPAGFTERMEENTQYLAYAAEYSSYGPFPAATAILSGTSSVKHALQVLLRPEGAGPIAFRSTSGIGEADASVDCTPPASLADNDIMLALVAVAQTTGSPAITAPAGWTELATATVTNGRISVYWKRASSESGNYTFSQDGSAGQVTTVGIVAYSGCEQTGNPYDTYGGTAYTVNNTSLIATLPLAFTEPAGPWKTSRYGATAARTAPGDVIRIAKSGAPASMGACSFTNASQTVTLPASVELLVDDCETAWTAAANVTAQAVTTSPTPVRGTYCAKLTPASAFTTGKLAYFTLASAVDLSAYQKVQFWLYHYITGVPAMFSLKLCSDTTGDTPVHSVPVHFARGQGWSPHVLDNGSALSSSIQSVALYADTDPGTYYIGVDSISALVAGAPDCWTPFGDQNTSEVTPWYPIRYIDGATVYLGQGEEPAYFLGTTGSRTGYAISPLADPSTTGDGVIQPMEGGTAASPITFSGGWDTSSNTQTGMSWFAAAKGEPGIYASQKDILVFERLGFIGFRYAIDLAHIREHVYRNVGVLGGGAGFDVSSTHIRDVVFDIALFNGVNTPLVLSASWISRVEMRDVKFWNSFDALATKGTDIVFRNCDFENLKSSQSASSYGAVSVTGVGSMCRFYNCRWGTTNLGSKRDLEITTLGQKIELYNCDITNISDASNYGYTRSVRHDQAANDHWAGGNAEVDSYLSEATVRHTASGIAWKLSPVSGATIDNSVGMPVAVIPCAASAQVTVSAWLRRTNTNLAARLIVKGHQIAGVDDDVTVSMTAAADTWEEVTLQFTPTAAGVVEVMLQGFGGAGESCYIDDLTISQA